MKASEASPDTRRPRPTRREYWRGVMRFGVLVGLTATLLGVLHSGWPALFTLVTLEKAVINVIGGLGGGVIYISLMYGLPNPGTPGRKPDAGAG